MPPELEKFLTAAAPWLTGVLFPILTFLNGYILLKARTETKEIIREELKQYVLKETQDVYESNHAKEHTAINMEIGGIREFRHKFEESVPRSIGIVQSDIVDMKKEIEELHREAREDSKEIRDTLKEISNARRN